MAVLIILTGKLQGKRVTLPEGEVTVGRDEACQIRLATTEISRFHCRIRCRGDSITVKDLGSRNGTIINDVAIEREQALLPGDTLRIGPVSFQYERTKSVNAEPDLGVRSAKKGTASDDSIMDWLSDDEPEGAGDTTIVPRQPERQKSPTPKPTVNTVDDVKTPFPPTGPKKFRTVGEEGEDIIQRHFELVQSGKLPKRMTALKSTK